MTTRVDRLQGRWVVFWNGRTQQGELTAQGNFGDKKNAEEYAAVLATKKPIPKMTWADYKKDHGITDKDLVDVDNRDD